MTPSGTCRLTVRGVDSIEISLVPPPVLPAIWAPSTRTRTTASGSSSSRPPVVPEISQPGRRSAIGASSSTRLTTVILAVR